MKRNWKISAKGTIWCESNGWKLFLRRAQSNGYNTRMHLDISKDNFRVAHRLDMPNICKQHLSNLGRLDKLIPYADAVANRIATEMSTKTKQSDDKETAIANEIIDFINANVCEDNSEKELF